MEEIIWSILINIFSSIVYDGHVGFFKRLQYKRFSKKLTIWIQRYIQKNDGTVLSTGDFEIFLRDYKLIEKIFIHVASGDNKVSKRTFVQEQIKLFHGIQRKPPKNIEEMDNHLREFIIDFYDKIEDYYKRKLSQKEKYIISKLNDYRNDVIEYTKKGFDIVDENIKGIKEILSENGRLSDKKVVWDIYEVLSKSILNGKSNEVIQIYPLIIGKSKDLELAISYLLNLFSIKKDIIISFRYLEENIEDDDIYDDICRITVYFNAWRKEKEELSKIGDRNIALKNISLAIINENYEKFYTIDEKKENGINYLYYNIKNELSEIWLVKRICILQIVEQNYFNTAAIISQTIDNPNNILDKVILTECKLKEIFVNTKISNEEKEIIYDEINALAKDVEYLNKEFKERIYTMLLKVAMLISDSKVEEVLKIIPKEVREYKEIDLLITEIDRKKGLISLDHIIQICIKYKEYWLFNNYLCEEIPKNPISAKETIDKYKFIIDIDPSIFLIYVNLIYDFVCKDTAIDLLLEYQNKYEKYLEFWIMKLKVKYDKNEMLYVIEKYKTGEINSFSYYGVEDYINLLFNHQMFEDALVVINQQEKSGRIYQDFFRLKALALCYAHYELEALSLFNQIFESGNQSEEIIYYILAISYNNKRLVSKTVLSMADKSEHPEILILLAGINVWDNNLDNAFKYNLKAMLRTSDDESRVFNQYLELDLLRGDNEQNNKKNVDVETVILLETKNKSEKKFVIHLHHFLPQEPYFWESAYHIYKETAIQMGLFRRKIGEVVCIDNIEYTIKSIQHINVYFFRLCMEKMVSNGSAKLIDIPLTEDNQINVNEFGKSLKSIIGDNKNKDSWLNQYKSLDKIPMTFYFGQRFFKLTYFQLVAYFLEDTTIFYRTDSKNYASLDGNYIFSFSALIILFKLGWKCSTRLEKYAITEVQNKVISEESEKIIQDNNRENVVFMGINDENFFVIESTEEEKSHKMQEIIEFKSYCKEFFSIDNKKDLAFQNKYHIDIKKIIGIVDYDALVIAKTNNKILVSGEIMVSGISQMPEIDVQSINVTDFITEEANDINELLDFVEKMIKYKFTIPFTDKTIKKIYQFFQEANLHQKQNIIDRWSYVLDVPIEDNNYKKVMVSHIQNCISNLDIDQNGSNPIYRCLLKSFLKYTNQKLKVSFNEKGELCVKLIKEKEEI